jgi:peptidoglycan/LPS O-acetylase OafA/YrhL
LRGTQVALSSDNRAVAWNESGESVRNNASAAVGGNRNDYRPEIDGLRALAVAAVIINHFDKNLLPSGYLGVDVFFVISGYVITWSLCSAPDAHLGNFLLDFYARRLKRLAPALLVCVAVTSVLVCLFDSNPNVSLNTGIAWLFGLSNLYLFHISTDYFAQATELNVFTNTWSLGVEERFYFVFPLVLWLSGLGQRPTSGTRHFSWIIGLASAASLTAFIYGSSNNPSATFFLMPPRF